MNVRTVDRRAPETGVRNSMGALRDLLISRAVTPRLHASSKRQVLSAMAETLAEAAGVEPRAAFEALLMRERLAGTGIGEGVALPHARVPGLARPMAGLARLDPPIDFEALDGRPADLVVMLLTPAERGGDHLKALAKLSRILRRADVREKLRVARTAEEMLAVFELAPETDAA
jgi:PTS system nitrogen regulatory IIA component